MRDQEGVERDQQPARDGHDRAEQAQQIAEREREEAALQQHLDAAGGVEHIHLRQAHLPKTTMDVVGKAEIGIEDPRVIRGGDQVADHAGPHGRHAGVRVLEGVFETGVPEGAEEVRRSTEPERLIGRRGAGKGGEADEQVKHDEQGDEAGPVPA